MTATADSTSVTTTQVDPTTPSSFSASLSAFSNENQNIDAPITINEDARKQEVAKVRAGINLNQPLSIQTIEGGLNDKLSEFNSRMLERAKVAHLGDVGEVITQIVKQAEGLDPTTINSNPSLLGRMFGRAKGGIEQFKLRQETVEQNFARIKERLQKDIEQAMADSAEMDTLADVNYEQFKKLEIIIVACEEALNEANTVTLPKMAALAGDGDPFKVQQVSRLREAIHRLSKKISGLRETRLETIQTALIIQGMQNNAIGIVETNSELINNALEQWKKGYAITLVQENQEKQSAFAKAAKDASNQMRLMNVARLEKNSLQIAQNNERGAIDCDVLLKTNETLIRTMDGVAKIHEEGRARRAEEAKKLVEMEKTLAQRVLQRNR